MARAILRESDIIQALKKALPEGQLVRFTPGPASPRGISDVLITYDGREHFCEVKVNDTRLTKLQKNFLRKRANPMLMHVDTRIQRVRVSVNDTGWSDNDKRSIKGICNLMMHFLGLPNEWHLVVQNIYHNEIKE